MSCKLPVLLVALTTAWGLQAAPGNGEPAGPIRADELIARAAFAAGTHHSLSASVRLRGELHGRSMVGSGVYLQQGRGDALHMRYELRLQIADRTYSLLVVCDGRYLWRDEQHPLGRHVTRVDMGRVRDLLADPSIDSAPPRPEWLLEGGLPALLASLSERFEFQSHEQVSLGGAAAYVVQGSWPDADGSAATGKDAGETRDPKPPGTELPETIPQEVMLVIGRDDLFPYVMEFRRRPAGEKDREPAVGGNRPLLRLELFAVQTGVRIDDANFSYRSGEQEWIDVTDGFVKRYGLESGP